MSKISLLSKLPVLFRPSSFFSGDFTLRKKLSDNLTKRVDLILRRWMTQNSSPQDLHAKQIAAERIKTCATRRRKDLDFNGLPISSLIGAYLPEHVERLFLMNTQVTCLEGVALPKNLKELYIDSARFLNKATLPKDLKIITLEDLNSDYEDSDHEDLNLVADDAEEPLGPRTAPSSDHDKGEEATGENREGPGKPRT